MKLDLFSSLGNPTYTATMLLKDGVIDNHIYSYNSQNVYPVYYRISFPISGVNLMWI